MKVKVHLPTALRPFADQQDTVILEGSNVGEILTALTDQFSTLKQHLLDDNGELRNYVNLYLNEEDVGQLGGRAAAVKDGDTILIVPAIAGGHSEGLEDKWNPRRL